MKSINVPLISSVGWNSAVGVAYRTIREEEST